MEGIGEAATEDNALYTPEILAHWQEKWDDDNARFGSANNPVQYAPDQQKLMVDGKNSFMSKQNGSYWKVPGSGVVNQQNTGAINTEEGDGWPSNMPGIYLVNAAQYGLIANDQAVKNAVTAALMKQVREPSTNWKRSAGPYGEVGDESKKSDNGRFANNNFINDADNCVWRYVEWFMRHCLAFWFNKENMTSAEVSEFKAWALYFGQFCMMERVNIDKLWTNRKSEHEKENPNVSNYGPYKGGDKADLVTKTNYKGDAKEYHGVASNTWLNNRRCKIQQACFHAGLVSGDAALIKYSVQCLMEVIAFYYSQEGNIPEHLRDGWASQGLNYAISTVFGFVNPAVMLARLGNRKAMDQTTRAGHGLTAHPYSATVFTRMNAEGADEIAATMTDNITIGTKDKSLATFLVDYGGYMDGTFKYKNPQNLLINGINNGDYQQSDVGDHAIAADYYRRINHPLGETIHQLALRTKQGIYGYKPSGDIQGQGSVTGHRSMDFHGPSWLWLYEDLKDKGIKSFPDETPLPEPDKKDQVLTLAPIPAHTVGDAPFQLVVSSTGPMPITLASSNTGVLMVVGTTATPAGVGTATVTATQPGNDEYNAADPVSQQAVVNAIVTEGQKVESFTLINADTEEAIVALTEGDVLNLATLPTRNLNVRANTTPDKVGSVVFDLSGQQTHKKTESDAPYALFGDTKGNYNAWIPEAGYYILSATPYTDRGGAGTAGTALTIRFDVIDRVLDPWIPYLGPVEIHIKTGELRKKVEG